MFECSSWCSLLHILYWKCVIIAKRTINLQWDHAQKHQLLISSNALWKIDLIVDGSVCECVSVVYVQSLGNTWLFKAMWEKEEKKKVRKHCRTDRHATKTHAFPTYTHTDIFTHMHTCSPAHSAPTRWAKRAVAAQWSGTRQKGRGWMGGGNSGGGAEVHRGREAARWRGGCRLGAGRSVPVQPGVQARLSRPPAPLSFLLPHLFSLSLSLPFHRPLSLTLCVCVCRLRSPQGSFTDR